MKVLFLDFDGVLNGDGIPGRHASGGLYLDPRKMELLKTIMDAAGARIVLTTSWRMYWEPGAENGIGAMIESSFRRYGLTVFDKVSQQPPGRGEQIARWLEEHPEVTDYAVLDDGFVEGKHITDHLVRTCNFRGGLDAQDARKAILILKGGSL